jgi:hypothetical protein
MTSSARQSEVYRLLFDSKRFLIDDYNNRYTNEVWHLLSTLPLIHIVTANLSDELILG